MTPAAAAPAPVPRGSDSLGRLHDDVVACRACPRLVEWRERAARDKRAAYAGEDYWGRPIPGFGDPAARLVVVGLAPAAHGGNRTGRIFTGDRSGDFLFGSLHRTGWANQATSDHREDGLALHGAWITAAVRCAPPDNAPTPLERDTCAPYLAREWALHEEAAVVVALGGFAWKSVWRLAGTVVRPAPRFGHLAEAGLEGGSTLVGSFHPSQQNTFTGRLTEPMLDAVFARARDLVAGRSQPSSAAVSPTA